ncbi:MAG TPA: hypothetical protein VGR76_03285, partial [Candidatus Angelobacter sp.]|nr:hypothetical protein [Candidatus Angelobacter sp.]
RAMQSCKRLIARLAHQFQFSTTLWKFDVLRVPKLKEIAVGDIAHADMVVIAAHDRDELPGEVKSWIAALPRNKKGGAKALVALLDGPEPAEAWKSPVLSYLQEIARQSEFDFFTHRCAEMESSPGSASELTGITEPEVLDEKGFDDPFRPRDWGLNE